MTMLNHQLETPPQDVLDATPEGMLAHRAVDTESIPLGFTKPVIPLEELNMIANHITGLLQRPTIVDDGRIVIGPSLHETSEQPDVFKDRPRTPTVLNPGAPTPRRTVVKAIIEAAHQDTTY